ncbi:MAG: ADP-ribosylation factor family protein [Promethearchaeota archaeon]
MSETVKRLLKSINKAKIVFCGLDYAGKTSLVNYLKIGHLTVTFPTYGLNLEALKYGEVIFEISDLGGHQDFRGFWENFMVGADIIVYVIDASDANRFPESKLAFNDVFSPVNVNKPVLILANKQDLTNCVKGSEITNYFELSKLERSWHVQETSVKTGLGIAEAFQWIYEQVTKQKIHPPLKILEIGIFDSKQKQTWFKVLEEKKDRSVFSDDLDILFQKIKESHFEIIHLKNYKVIFREFDQFLSYVIIEKMDSEPLAQNLLKKLLDAIPEFKSKNLQKQLDHFIENQLPEYIEQINRENWFKTSS